MQAYPGGINHVQSSRRVEAIMIFSDASSIFWSRVTTQVPVSNQKRSFHEQRHEPPAFLSGKFNFIQMGLSTLEKETFYYHDIIGQDALPWSYTTRIRLVWRSLQFFLHLRSSVYFSCHLPTHCQESLHRAVRLCLYQHIWINIKGTDNAWEDLLCRWTMKSTFRRLHFTLFPLPLSAHPQRKSLSSYRQRKLW